MAATLLLTGFEPFLDVAVNPSGEIAQRLDGQAIAPGVTVRGVVLPVSFARAPETLGVALSELDAAPLAIVSLGVHRGPAFRLESRARNTFASAKPDNDGAFGEGLVLDGPAERFAGSFAGSLAGPAADRAVGPAKEPAGGLDLDRALDWLRDAGARRTMLSDDAGGYLCERVFRAGLDHAEEGGIAALFLHVPPVEEVPLADQEIVVAGFLGSLVQQLNPA